MDAGPGDAQFQPGLPTPGRGRPGSPFRLIRT